MISFYKNLNLHILRPLLKTFTSLILLAFVSSCFELNEEKTTKSTVRNAKPLAYEPWRETLKLRGEYYLPCYDNRQYSRHFIVDDNGDFTETIYLYGEDCSDIIARVESTGNTYVSEEEFSNERKSSLYDDEHIFDINVTRDTRSVVIVNPTVYKIIRSSYWCEFTDEILDAEPLDLSLCSGLVLFESYDYQFLINSDRYATKLIVSVRSDYGTGTNSVYNRFFEKKGNDDVLLEAAKPHYFSKNRNEEDFFGQKTTELENRKTSIESDPQDFTATLATTADFIGSWRLSDFIDTDRDVVYIFNNDNTFSKKVSVFDKSYNSPYPYSSYTITGTWSLAGTINPTTTGQDLDLTVDNILFYTDDIIGTRYDGEYLCDSVTLNVGFLQNLNGESCKFNRSGYQTLSNSDVMHESIKFNGTHLYFARSSEENDGSTSLKGKSLLSTILNRSLIAL